MSSTKNENQMINHTKVKKPTMKGYYLDLSKMKYQSCFNLDLLISPSAVEIERCIDPVFFESSISTQKIQYNALHLKIN